MNDCCNFYAKFLLVAFTLMFSLGNLQAQSQPNCDLSKCSPAERALCAKICASTNSATANLLNVFSVETVAAKTNCNPANCQPSDCKKTDASSAKLVSAEIKTAPDYSSNLATNSVKTATTEKKKCCALKCNKTKTSL